MEAVESIDYMRDVEPAPGRLELVRRFVNTVDHEHGREVLHSPARSQALLVELGLLDGRHAGHRGAISSARSSSAKASAGSRSRTTTARRTRCSRRSSSSASTAAPACSSRARRDVDGALADLVGIVYTAMADGTWSRLKACRRDVCQWLFYDRSRNQSAVWCQMAVCGNRTKTKAYRARREAPPARTGRR